MKAAGIVHRKYDAIMKMQNEGVQKHVPKYGKLGKQDKESNWYKTGLWGKENRME